MNTISIQFKNKTLKGEVKLPSSKSISNRYLILQFLAEEDFELRNLSESEDTKLMQKLLDVIADHDEDDEDEVVLDCLNAGAVIRFLTAQLAFRPGNWVLTSSNPRMQARPIGPLVDSLRALGIKITYLGEEGYPPLRVIGKPEALLDNTDLISVDASQSSQFVSALMMTAPLFPHGLHIEMLGETKVSLPYIQMTAQLMRNCGAEVVFIDGSNMFIDGPLHAPSQALIEADWTSASYLYGLLALAESGRIELPLLFEIDREPKEYDFVHHPDLAQTMAVCCAALGIEARLTGIFGLRYKETDRIIALRDELARMGAKVECTESEFDNELHIFPSELHPEKNVIRTYGDHRMALSFSLLAMKYGKITLDDKEVVNKSFPGFWQVLKRLGAK